MDLTCIPQQKPDFRLEQLDGELLLYHPSRTTIIYCNPTASLIWQLCDGARPVAEIVSLLSAAYEQPADTLAAEVTATLEEFRQQQAIEYVGEPARKSG